MCCDWQFIDLGLWLLLHAHDGASLFPSNSSVPFQSKCYVYNLNIISCFLITNVELFFDIYFFWFGPSQKISIPDLLPSPVEGQNIFDAQRKDFIFWIFLARFLQRLSRRYILPAVRVDVLFPYDDFVSPWLRDRDQKLTTTTAGPPSVWCSWCKALCHALLW